MAAASILVVDDDPDTCACMSDVIADLGYQVEVAYAGPAALVLFKRQSYALALLDFKLPGMNDVQLCRHLKQGRAKMVGILVTAFASSETIIDASEAGMRQVIPKPLNFAYLIPIIKEVAGEA